MEQMNRGQTGERVMVEEFRNLLREISGARSGTLIRFRKTGGQWQRSFIEVFDAEKGAIFYDREDKEFIYVTDLSEISEFQLNNSIGLFRSEATYEVMPIQFFQD
jgi:hypothetical protein